MSYKENILFDLEWGDKAKTNYENVERVSENGGDDNDDSEVVGGVSGDAASREGEHGSPTSSNEIRQRVQYPPGWMQNYVTRENLPEDEANMALMVSRDPIHFEDAVRNANWRLAMDCEINSIEKNKT